MNDLTDGALFVIIVADLVIIWGIIISIKQLLHNHEMDEIRRANLLGDFLEIEFSEDDLEIMEQLARLDNCPTNEKYLRKIIKQVTREGA